jgi:hypothetical protein
MTASAHERLVEVVETARAGGDRGQLSQQLNALYGDIESWQAELAELQLPSQPDDDQRSMLEQSTQALEDLRLATEQVASYLGDGDEATADAALEMARRAHLALEEVRDDSQANIDHLTGKKR